MQKDSRIFVAGQSTLIGSSLQRALQRDGFEGAIEAETLDLAEAPEVEAFFQESRPEYVFLAAGKSAGIDGNQKYPADLILNNLRIECNVIDSAFRHSVRRLVYLASSCAYPKLCPQPMRVESLLTGALEPTSEAYAVAKIAGIHLCQAYRRQHGADFIAAIPADAFGPGDAFGIDEAHVVAALIRRMHEAKLAGTPTVEIWGSGNQRREFIFVDDLADACIFVMDRYRDSIPINLGGGADASIGELAVLIREVVEYAGELRFDSMKPEGMPFKALDATRLLDLGWRPRVPLRAALVETYDWYLQNLARIPSFTH